VLAKIAVSGRPGCALRRLQPAPPLPGAAAGVEGPGAEALAAVETLARRVLGVDTFFDWTSDRDPSDDHGST
jgi:hypothetical protein